MSTFEAVFIKIENPPDVVLLNEIYANLQQNGLPKYDTVNFRYSKDYPWLQIQDLPWTNCWLEATEEVFSVKFAAALSALYSTDVICIYYQSVVDAIGYWHFQNGSEKRGLVYGFIEQGVWKEVRGNPEPWEESVFFEDLPTELIDEMESDEDDDYLNKCREIYKTKHFAASDSFPFFSSFDVSKIGKFFNLPNPRHWDIDEDISTNIDLKLTFRPKYLLLTVLIFAVEVCIALFFKDPVIRPFVGDVLVVILIYCFFSIFLKFAHWKIALGVLIFACLIEILQYFDYVKLLGLENNRVLSVIMGRTFEWTDFLAYLTGFLIILLCEKILRTKNEVPDNL